MARFFLCYEYFNFQVYLILVTFTVLRFFQVDAIETINYADIEKNLVPLETNTTTNLCPISFDNSTFNQTAVSILPEDLYTLSKRLSLSRGGEWKPKNCEARFSIALIIPYRDRESHLSYFIRYIHAFLQAQNIHYKIYIIEQNVDQLFNRGAMLNIGYLEAKKDKNYPCFIFNDVNKIPANLNNIYACSQVPRHMAVLVSVFKYSLPYETYFDGAVSFLPEHFEKINGFSNRFFGWGGDDEDLYNRVIHHGIEPIRFPNNVSTYLSLVNGNFVINENWRTFISEGSQYFTFGLNSVKYSVINRVEEPLFTRITVKLLASQ